MTDIKQYEPLWGSWYVDEQLGEGAYGKVYKVHKEEFGRIYEAAVKIISIPQSEADIIQAKSEGLNDESARSYFQAFVTDIIQEVDLMNAFHGNSNIVSLEDHKVIEKKGEIGWDIIIRMELLETLSSYITRKPMTQAEIIKLGINICQALELCAKHHTIHRDIKPDNIFVSQYGDYKLGDFGIARQIERTMSGLSKKGTYQYMAPEVFKGEEYGASVDIYSLGIVMYRFLNKNRAPFLPEYPNPITPKDREEALQMRMKGEKLPDINGINENLNAIVLKACSYNKEDRFRSAAEMREALESIFTHKNDSALNLPIVELSDKINEDDNNYDTETYTSKTQWGNNTEEKTQIIFSQKMTKSLENQNIEQSEPKISVPEKIIKNLSIFSSIFWGLLIILAFLSGNLSDILTFVPLYIFCLIQCSQKFENKIINYSHILYLCCYLLYSMLFNFKLFDYSFLIFTLCLLSLISSSKKIFQIINCAAIIVFALIFAILIFNININTHYIYVYGAAAIPILMLMSSPIALLLGKIKNVSDKLELETRKFNFTIALLMALQFFTLTIFIIYATGLTNNPNLLYYIINANFPGFSLERLSWWKYGRFIGIIIQLFAFTSLFMISMAIITPPKFLLMIQKGNRNSIIKSTLLIIIILVINFLILSKFLGAF